VKLTFFKEQKNETNAANIMQIHFFVLKHIKKKRMKQKQKISELLIY
jgi:hypothetical protein